MVMASAEVEAPPGLPDYLLDPNATLKDHDSKWRYGKAPDYSNTRKVYEQSTFDQHSGVLDGEDVFHSTVLL